MSSFDRSTVSAGQDLRLIGPDDLTLVLTCDLHYSREDPYAIRMSLDVAADDPVDWIFSRELLAAALRGREGIGDVRAWPSAAPAAFSAGEKILNLELGPPDGYARFEASATEIEAFLARTYELVPRGEESDFLNLDDELTELLSQP